MFYNKINFDVMGKKRMKALSNLELIEVLGGQFAAINIVDGCPKDCSIYNKEDYNSGYIRTCMVDNEKYFNINDIKLALKDITSFKIGDKVEPVHHYFTLASGCEYYNYAYVVNNNPFQLISESGDMLWRSTVQQEHFKLISSGSLPEKVIARMEKEGI